MQVTSIVANLPVADIATAREFYACPDRVLTKPGWSWAEDRGVLKGALRAAAKKLARRLQDAKSAL